MGDFGKRIRAQRVKLGYTQSEFAELLGVSFRAVQQWEGGRRRPHYGHMILAAAEALPGSKTPRAGKPGRKPPAGGKPRKKRKG